MRLLLCDFYIVRLRIHVSIVPLRFQHESALYPFCINPNQFFVHPRRAFQSASPMCGITEHMAYGKELCGRKPSGHRWPRKTASGRGPRTPTSVRFWFNAFLSIRPVVFIRRHRCALFPFYMTCYPCPYSLVCVQYLCPSYSAPRPLARFPCTLGTLQR